VLFNRARNSATKCNTAGNMSHVRWLPPLTAVLCGLLTIECAWSRYHATSSVIAVLPPQGQRCGTVCLNSFGNRTSPSDNSDERWKHLCLVSWACVWTLKAPTRNLLTYLLTWTTSISDGQYQNYTMQWNEYSRHFYWQTDVTSNTTEHLFALRYYHIP